MNINDAMGIAHPHFSIRDTFLEEAKKAVAFLESASSKAGYDILCSDIEVSNEHVSFTAEIPAKIAEDSRYAEFILWFEDGQMTFIEMGHEPVQATIQALTDLVNRWAPVESPEYELSPYHSDSDRF